MKNLFKALPNFSPDYSGVCSALFELGGLCVIVDPIGCTSVYVTLDEPRYDNKKSAILSAGLREIDTILGDDNRLVSKIIYAAKDLKPKFIALIGTPIPMLIGTDLEGVSLELENKLNIPVFSISADGTSYYDKGISDALLKLAELFTYKPKNKIKNSINILGATPMDVGTSSEITDIKRLFEENGIKVISTWAMGSSIDEIKESSSAEKNVVISVSGLAAAKYMRDKYGIPYTSLVPIGNNFKHNNNNVIYDNEEANTLIIGEQIFSNSLRNYLRHKIGILKVQVASFFLMEKSLEEKGDFFIEDEGYLMRKIREGRYKNVIGDPVLKKLFKGELCERYFEIPHIPISSRVHWNECKSFIGKNAEKYIKLGRLNTNEK